MIERIYIVRHGETAWSLSGQYTGRADIPLTAHGRDTARKLAPSLREIAFAHVLASPLLRARQTCELAGLGAGVQVDPDLAEWDYGDYEGRTPAQILASRPAWKLFRDGAPGGESPQRVSARADRVIARLRRLDGNVALFSHGHFGRALAARWIGLPVLLAQRFLFDTSSLGVLCYEHGCSEQPAIGLWNAASPGTGMRGIKRLRRTRLPRRQ